MTNKEREDYAKQFARTNRKFEKTNFSKVKRSLDKVVSSLIGTIKRKGPNQAVVDLRTQLWNDDLYGPIEKLYKQVGVYWANQTYRLIRREAGQKGLGRDEQWVAFIISELEKTLLQYAVVKTSETLRNHLLLVLQNAIQKELTVDEIVKILSQSGFTAMQAERIVRTEVGRAANTGVKAAAEGFNYEMVKEWIAFRDQRTRGFKPEQPKDHFHMDGQVVDFYDNFIDPRSKEQIEYPLAPGGSAAMVINCRCSYIVVPKRDARGRLIMAGKPVTQPKTPQVFDNEEAVNINPVFAPAKNVAEAESWAKENLKTKVNSYKGVDLNVANTINKTLYNIESKFKETPNTEIGFNVTGKAYAQFDWNKNVLDTRKKYANLNERLATDNETWQKRYPGTGPYMIAEDLESIIMHEYAHAWDSSTNRRLYNEITKLDLDLQNRAFGISGYASSDRFYTTKSKGSEMIAELINAKLVNHRRFNALPDEIKNLVNKYFNE